MLMRCSLCHNWRSQFRCHKHNPNSKWSRMNRAILPRHVLPKGNTYIWWVVSLLCATVKHREMNYFTLSQSLSPRQSAIEFKVRNCLHFSGLRPMQRVPYGMHIMQSIAINFMRMWVAFVEYVVKTRRKWSRRRKTDAEDEPKIQLFPLQLQKCR